MRRLAAVPLFLALLVTVRAADPAVLPPEFDWAVAARPIGPANMSGRVTALAVVESRPATMYVGAASGGVWKTTDNGGTWEPLFDDQAVASIGDVAVAPSNPDVVWVGTGEANARNSVSWGDGVYQSVDGGKTWKHRGLKETRHIGKIVIHPKDPDTVYVAALGHVWAPNTERGLFKTTDGGRTWKCLKYIDDETGFVDLAMDPSDPETLYAAAYRVRRDAFSGPNPKEMYGKDAGLYRTTDGGKTWKRLTKGLPDRPIGRCGISVYKKDPKYVYAVVQTDKTDVRVVAGQGPKTGTDVEIGGVFRSEDRGESWKKVNDLCPRPFYFSQIRVDPNDVERVYVCGVPLFRSTDGGKTFSNKAAPGVHADMHALWIDPADSDHHVIGCDGGVYVTTDRGAHWEHFKNLPIAQFYGLAVDMRTPYRVYGGLQDNGSWGGPSRTKNKEGIGLADWVRILGADGFQCAVDPNNVDTVYAEWQYGRFRRLNLAAAKEKEKEKEKDITPKAAKEAPAYRFNWNAPILLSPHDPKTVYYGGDHLFRSRNRGDDWDVISPDLTKGKPGPSANTGNTLTAVAESPRKAGVLYVGSDDGLVHVTRDGGKEWTDVSARLPDVPEDRWITKIECSPFAEGTAFLSLSRHRNDDHKPYLFRTEDYGATWKSIASNLPADGPVHVVRCDPRNPDLLYVGTEFGLFVSLNGGAKWQRLRAGLPTVAVHDLVIHPRDRELVIGTHGRGIYIVDVVPLQGMTASALAEPAHLFEVRSAKQFEYLTGRGAGTGKSYLAPNPEYGAAIYFHLKEKPAGEVTLTVRGAEGKPLAKLKGAAVAGLQRVQWDLKTTPDDPKDAAEVKPGEYTVELRVAGQVLSRKVRVEAEE
jgi:photosystem II stability/assembly factor-like uncharacterized protein